MANAKMTVRATPGIHLDLTKRDKLKACPFCGRAWDPYCDPDDADDDDFGPELQNTGGACYWIRCPCGVELTGKSFADARQHHEQTREQHLAAKRDVVKKWNTRCAS